MTVDRHTEELSVPSDMPVIQFLDVTALPAYDIKTRPLSESRICTEIIPPPQRLFLSKILNAQIIIILHIIVNVKNDYS